MDLARAANIQALTALSIPMNLEEVRSGELARMSLEGSNDFEPGLQFSENEARKERYKLLLATWLIFYERDSGVLHLAQEEVMSNE